MQRIDQEGETVAMMSLTVMPIAQDEANFTKVCRRVESAFNIQKCKVRTLANLQKEGFQSISPTYPANSTVDSIVSRIIPMSTFVGGFPFASSGYNDGRGYYFAKDSNGGLVILDTWERGNDRTNSSFVIMGVAGIGKSTVVKHIMLSEYMKGTKILCIDPESEYKDMCRNLNGSWLNAGGGKNGRSNLLQIRPASSGKRIFGSSRPRIFPFCPTFMPCWKRKRRPTRRIRYIVIWQCCSTTPQRAATAFYGTATPRWRPIPGLFAWIPTTCKMRRIMSSARSI